MTAALETEAAVTAAVTSDAEATSVVPTDGATPCDRPTVVLVVAGIAARVLVGMALCLLGWAAIPAAFGLLPTTVMSGSMEPRIMTGDVVVAMPVDPDDLAVGQVVLADRPTSDQDGTTSERLLHRVDEIGDDRRLRTKGDANRDHDRVAIEPSAVHGVGVLRVPWVGVPIVWVRAGSVVPLVMLGLVAAAALWTIRAADRRLAALDAPRDARAPTNTTRRLIGPAVLVGAVGLVAVLVVAGGSSAAYSSSSTSAGTMASASAYDCFGRAQDTPALRYGFDEAAGSLLRDSSGSGRDGVMTGQSTRVDGGCDTNPYLHLNGVNGHAFSTSPTGAPSVFTIDAWIRTTAPRGKIVGFGDATTTASANNDRQLYLTPSGRVAFGVYNPAAPAGPYVAVVSPDAVTDGRWHHLAASLSPAGMRLYVDGVLVGSDPNAAALDYGGFWRIGWDRLYSGWPEAPSNAVYAGDVDTFTVFDTALSDAQVAAHAAAGR